MNDFCVPDNEFEWRDILLKCGCREGVLLEFPYYKYPFIWKPPASAFPLLRAVNLGLYRYMSTEDFLEKYRTDKPKDVDPHLSLEGRVRELELKDDLFVRIIQRLNYLEIKGAMFDDILKRLTVLEKEGDKKQRLSPDGCYTGETSEHWSISINPKASPKNIPFSIALEYMKVGRRTKRSAWRQGIRLDGREFRLGGGGFYYLWCEDMSYQDWEVIEE